METPSLERTDWRELHVNCGSHSLHVLDMGVNLLLAVELSVVISAKVVEVKAGEDEVNSDEDRMSNGQSSTIFASVSHEARVLSGEEGRFVFDSRFGALCESGFEGLVTGRSFAALTFTSTLIVTRTDTGPLAETVLILEARHINARLGDDLLGGNLSDTRNIAESLDSRFVVVAEAALNHLISLFDLSSLLSDDIHDVSEELPLRRSNGPF